jgi:hypothetical protein
MTFTVKQSSPKNWAISAIFKNNSLRKQLSIWRKFAPSGHPVWLCFAYYPSIRVVNQIGRIFCLHIDWVIVYFGQFVNTKVHMLFNFYIPTFFYWKKICINLVRNELGYILADFFTNS